MVERRRPFPKQHIPEGATHIRESTPNPPPQCPNNTHPPPTSQCSPPPTITHPPPPPSPPPPAPPPASPSQHPCQPHHHHHHPPAPPPQSSTPPPPSPPRNPTPRSPHSTCRRSSWATSCSKPGTRPSTRKSWSAAPRTACTCVGGASATRGSCCRFWDMWYVGVLFVWVCWLGFGKIRKVGRWELGVGRGGDDWE